VGLRRWSPDEAEIKRLFVADDARGRGVGRKLLTAAVNEARSMGYRQVVLDTDGSSAAALALFRSMAFEASQGHNGNRFAKYWFRKHLV
jgi:ribosomal protein S18 acetylase RimI-like enzyme